MESINILNKNNFQKKFNQYLIKFFSDIDLINISILQDNSKNFYQSYFHLTNLRQFKLLSSNKTTKEKDQKTSSKG